MSGISSSGQQAAGGIVSPTGSDLFKVNSCIPVNPVNPLYGSPSPHSARSSGVLGLAQQPLLYGSPPPRRAGSSGVLNLASQLSGRKTSSVRVDGALVDMDIGDLPFPDGPPPQTPLTKKAKASGGGLADMGQQALGSVPTSDPLCLRSLSPVLSPITGIGLSQVSSMPDTPSPLRQTLRGTSDVLISSQPEYEQNTDLLWPRSGARQRCRGSFSFCFPESRG
jgi:hypothetical protein